MTEFIAKFTKGTERVYVIRSSWEEMDKYIQHKEREGCALEHCYQHEGITKKAEELREKRGEKNILPDSYSHNADVYYWASKEGKEVLKTKECKFCTLIKKFFQLFCMILLPINIYAYDFYVDGIYYNITSSTLPYTANVMSYYYGDDYSGKVTIPSNVTYDNITYSVTSIGGCAFSHCSGLTSITIPNSVTSIGYNAFSHCSGLTSVTIPNSVTSIGSYAFEDCSGLTSITIGNSVTSIGWYAFEDCSALTRVDITDLAAWCKISFGSYDANPCYYAHHLYLNNEEITELVIPYSVTSIGNYAFYNCLGLTSITIPNSVTSIGYGAFSGCSGLTSVTIPNSVTSIESYTFYGCSLKSLTIGSGVLSIGYAAFTTKPKKTIWLTNTPPTNYTNAAGEVNYVSNDLYTNLSNTKVYPYLSSLFTVEGVKYAIISPSERTCDVIDCEYNTNAENVHIGETVTYKKVSLKVQNVNEYAIYMNSYVKDVTLYNNGYIGECAFYGCNSIQNLVASNNGLIDKYAFYNTSSIETADISNSGNVGENAFENSGIQQLTISNDGNIETKAFYNTGSLETAEVTNAGYVGESAFENSGVQSLTISNDGNIGEKAFYNCVGLKTLNASNNGDIGANAFYGTSALETAEITNTGYVGESAFENSGVQQLTISNDGNIEKKAFYNCTQMQTLNASNNGYIGTNAFYGTSALETAELTNKGNIGPNAFENSGVQILTLSNEGNVLFQAFYNTTSLKTADIANTGYIGGNAFENSGVQQLTISNDGDIDSKAFYNTGSLETADVTNAGYVGASAFENSGVQNLILNNEGDVGSMAFRGCTRLISAIIGNKIPSIGNYAFYGCTSLPSIVIPNEVTNLGSYAVQNCTALESAKIGDGVAALKDYVFSGCSSLTDVKIGSGVASINQYAFNDCSALPKITIPANVGSIDNYVFGGCSSLADVIINDRAETLTLGSNGSSPMFYDCPLDSVYIGGKLSYNTSSSYGYSPFYRNTSLRTVVVTDEEVKVYDNEFYGCTGLKSVSIGNGTTSIGKWAFSDCPGLEYFSFGQKVKIIDQEAFSDCVGITQLISKATTPPACGTQALDDISKWDCELTVPESSVDAYYAAEQWKEFFFINGSEIPGDVLATSLTLDKSEETMGIGEEMTLTATILPEDVSSKSLFWTTSDKSVATVVNGVVTAHKEGTATITAKTKDGSDLSASCVITVEDYNFMYVDANSSRTNIKLNENDAVTILDSYKALTVTEDIEVSDVTYTRSFSSTGSWQAWYVPFDVDYDAISDKYIIAQIQGVLTDSEGSPCIAFLRINSGTVKANTPYVVRPKQSGEISISTGATTLHATTDNSFCIQSVSDNFTFGGLYTRTQNGSHGWLALNKNGMFQRLGESVYLAPFRFHMTIEAREDNPYAISSADAKEVPITVIGDDATGVSHAENVGNAGNVGNLYNLSGQKVANGQQSTADSLPKGIYIINGKKIFVK